LKNGTKGENNSRICKNLQTAAVKKKQKNCQTHKEKRKKNKLKTYLLESTKFIAQLRLYFR
jgi:hypothetical protein